MPLVDELVWLTEKPLARVYYVRTRMGHQYRYQWGLGDRTFRFCMHQNEHIATFSVWHEQPYPEDTTRIHQSKHEYMDGEWPLADDVIYPYLWNADLDYLIEVIGHPQVEESLALIYNDLVNLPQRLSWPYSETYELT
jgi:hypothetical protein